MRAFLIPAELGNTAPLVIEHHRQRVIHSAGEGKGGRKSVPAPDRADLTADTARHGDCRRRPALEPHRRSKGSPASRGAAAPGRAGRWRSAADDGRLAGIAATASEPGDARRKAQRLRHLAGQHLPLAAEAFALRMVKPASCRPRRTKPAEVKVASVPPGRASAPWR